MKKNLHAKKSSISGIALFFLLLTVSFANAATRTSVASGNWNAAATWGGTVPATTDDVIIAAGHTVTVTAAATIANLSLNATTSKLIINNTFTLTVSGTFTNSGTTTNGVNGPGTIMFIGTATFGSLTPTGIRPIVKIGNGVSTNTVTVGANTLIDDLIVNVGATLSILTRTIALNGDFTNNGTVTGTTGQVNPTGNFSSTGSFVYSGAGFLKLGGNFTYSGTFTLGSAQVQFTGTANQSIQGFTTTGTVSMLKTGGTATLTSDTNGAALTINGLGGSLNLGSGTHEFTGTWTRTAGTVNGGSSWLKIGGNLSGTGGTFIAGTGTVEFNRNAGQSVPGLTYNNVILSGTTGTRIKTFDVSPTVNGKLTLAGTGAVAVTSGGIIYGTNATLQYDLTSLRTVSSVEWMTPFAAAGGVVINGNQTITLNAAKVFNAGIPLTINSGAKLATGNLSLTLGGDFINNGGTFSAGSSPIVIANTMTTQSIAGFTTTGLVSMTKTAGTATFGGNVSSVGLTINGAGGILNLGSSLNHTITGAVALTAGTLNGGSSTLNVNFTGSAWTGTGSLFVAGTGTVNFGGVAQTLAVASTFNNLTFSNSGVKTLTGVTTVNGILSMEGTATVSVAPTYGAAATLQYNRTVAQGTGVEWITPFAATGGVSVINTGVITVATAAKVFNSGVPLNIGTGATLNNGGFAISGGSTLTIVDTGTLQLSGTSIFPVFTTTTLGTNSAVNYNGTAQTVAVKNYGDLLLSGSGNKTFAGATNIAGDFLISGTAVALLPNTTTSSCGTLTLGGTLQTNPGSYGAVGSGATTTSATYFGSTTTGVINAANYCVPGTWLGTTSTDWNDATNWCGGNKPTATTNVTIGNTTNKPVIGTGGGLCKNITIATGASLTISASNTLTVSGNWINNGTFTSNTSTVNLNGTVAQTIGGSTTTTFNNLTNSNTVATISSTTAITVNGILGIANSNSVLDMGTFALSGGSSFSNTGAGQIKTANTSSAPIPSGKTWTNTILYTSLTGGQTIVAGTYNGTPSLEIDNTSGTQTATGNITIGGQLNINNGGTPVFDLNGYNLTTNKLNIVAPNSVLDIRGGTLNYTTVLSMEGKVRFSGATNGKPFASGTVEYYGTTQAVAGGSYFNLLFSGASGVYTIASDLDVDNALNITNGAVTLKDGYTLSVDAAVTVVNPATFTIENNASLLQTTYTGPNSGNVIVKRNTTPVLHRDATFWCSPTTGTQTLAQFSPGTDTNRYNGYDSTTDKYTYLNAATDVFAKGVGYSITCPDNTSSTVPTILPHQFVGVPNNGSFTIPLSVAIDGSGGLSLVGNPYASALNADDFINGNLYDAVNNPTNTLTGTYYFWSHNTRLTGNDFSSDDYYTCNLFGSTGYTNSGTGNNTLPTGFIASGQGFFVENIIAGNLKFDNTMREQKNNTNFYRTKAPKKVKDLERHGIWLDMTNSALTTGNQTLVGYVENATNDYDPGYDSALFDDKRPLLVYSLIGTDAMAIQGRALPFTDLDTVPMGYFTQIADNITISINHVEGLFLDNQGIYLEDKLLNVIHDMKEEPYTFASDAGTFNDRFVLRYTDGGLATKDFNAQWNKVLVSVKNKEIKISSSAETIDKVVVYDLLGRQIYQKGKVNSNELSIANLVSAKQVLLVKTTLQNGKTLTTKVVY